MKLACPIQTLVSGGIPRYRQGAGPALLSAGFRPFFLLAALWAALAVPLWLATLEGIVALPTILPPVTWHAHEMIYGFAAAAVAGFLLTAIPNWTGRMPLQNGPLAGLVGLWLAGRIALLMPEALGPWSTAVIDLAFPSLFLATIAREIIAGKNWRNAPMLVALGLLLTGNLLVHLEAVSLAGTASLGIRLGIATLLMLIGLVGGRIIPSFTGNWLARQRSDRSPPALFDRFDRGVLAVTGVTLVLWVADPDLVLVPWLALLAGAAQLARLSRWRGAATFREPLLFVLHIGYAWVGIGFLLLAASAVTALPASAALHAFTAGAVGTMILGVMTRASLGHTGNALAAGPATIAIYILVTVAAALRVGAPLLFEGHMLALVLSGLAWSAAFGLFVQSYAPILLRPRARPEGL